MKERISMNIPMSEELKTKIKDKAKSERRPMSSMARIILEDSFKDTEENS